MLQWKETYATKHKIVDDQHKKLFDIVNGFEAAVRNKIAEASIQQTLQALGDYVKTHFADEERIMEFVRCSSCAENKKAHAGFLAVYTKSQHRFQSEGYSDALANELLKVAQEWIIQHICGIDISLRYCPCPEGNQE